MTQRSAALLFCVALVKMYAQTSTATIVGIVTDPGGARVSGANVEVRNNATNALRKAQSDAKGEFFVPNLTPGKYDVSAIKDGFRTERQTGLELLVDQEVRLEFKLQLGAVSQSVDIEASVPLINTENQVKGDVVVADEMIEMPLIARDFTDLAYLTPGVIQNTVGVGGASQSPMAINGSRADNSNFVIDGFNDRDARDGSAQVHPNIDAMQEFKMQVSGYSADTGRQAGGVMSMVLKTGGNQVHGSLFEFFRNDALNARNFFDTAKPSVLRHNDFGGTVSGPVWIPKLYNGKNRTFFLFSWESTRQDAPTPVLSEVPTLAERQGNFAGVLPALKNPFSTPANAPFPSNQIPMSMMSPSALAIQAFYPLPNNNGVNNLYADPAAPSTSNNYIAKIDQKIGASGYLSFKYLTNRGTSTTPFVNAGNTGIFGQTGWSHSTLAGITFTETFSPTLVNEFRFGVTRTVGYGAPAGTGTNYDAQFGLPAPSVSSLWGFPEVLISNFDQIGGPPGFPNTYYSTNYNTSDTMTWVKGSHLIKFGGDMLPSQIAETASTGERGIYQFTGFWTNQPYGDFLLGTLNASQREVVWDKPYFNNGSYSLFVQDDWKVSNHLTLNLGLRYELPKPIYEKYGRLTNFIPSLNKLVVASLQDVAPGVTVASSSIETAQQAGLPPALVSTDYKDFAPRFGLAWRPFGGNRTVVRGGYGIFYGSQGLVINQYAALGVLYPFDITQSVSRTASPSYLTLATPFPTAPNLSSAPTSVASFQNNSLTPYAQNWNFTVEQAIGADSAIEVSYAGSRGVHLARAYNLNQAFDRSAALPNGITPYPQWATITYFGFGFDSSYNAGSITFRRRLVHNFFFRLNYTYSKSIDDGSELQGGGAGGFAAVQDTQDLGLERGRSDLDMGHVFTMSFSWTVPWKTGPWISGLLIRGWQLAGTGIAHTGAPFTPQVSGANLLTGQANRPNRIAKGTLPNPSVNDWYNVSDFPQVPTGSFSDGTSGRNILDDPGAIAINAALFRNFAVREGSKLQFRWEIFNVLNHTNLGVPVLFVNTPNAATITSAGMARQMQVGIRYSF